MSVPSKKKNKKKQIPLKSASVESNNDLWDEKEMKIHTDFLKICDFFHKKMSRNKIIFDRFDSFRKFRLFFKNAVIKMDLNKLKKKLMENYKLSNIMFIHLGIAHDLKEEEENQKNDKNDNDKENKENKNKKNGKAEKAELVVVKIKKWRKSPANKKIIAAQEKALD